IAGFTPIPYKVFAIAAGVFYINFWKFVMVTVISRSARFFIVAGLIMAFGQQIKVFIDKYFNILSVIFVVLLLGGFYAMKYIKMPGGKKEEEEIKEASDNSLGREASVDADPV
ncbi:MAG: YqaA family protein, partial [Vulcanimicrobiota bacterium]